MEKLSERIQSLKPSQSQRLKADAIDTVIYLLTMLPLVNVYSPLVNKDDFSWFRAIIIGSLIFIVLNYFIRYYIPTKTKGATIGKLIAKTKVVDFYGYEVKPGQLLQREAIYIFLPIAIFSKIENFNYALLAIWTFVLLRGLYNAYILMPRSRKVILRLAKNGLAQEVETPAKEFTPEQINEFGGGLKALEKEKKQELKEALKALKSDQKAARNQLKENHAEALTKLSVKEEIYQTKVAQKLETKALQSKQKEAINKLHEDFIHDVLHLQTNEINKAKVVIDRNLPEKPDFLTVQEFVAYMPGFLEAVQSIENFKDKEELIAFMEQHNLDEIPNVFKKMKNDNLKSIQFVHAIENDESFIFDLQFNYENVRVKKERIVYDEENDDKNRPKYKEVEVVVPYEKVRTLKAKAFKENGHVVLQFNEPRKPFTKVLEDRLFKAVNENQGRTLLEVTSNTVVVDAYRFDKFYEEHRSEE